MKRTFIALKIPLTKNALEQVNHIKNELKAEKIKWVESWNLHITLFFMGDTDENKINEIGRSLAKSLEKLDRLKLNCKSLGVFKSIFNPKALWIGISESENLKELKLVIDKTMSNVGFLVGERLFKPHLTIGRMKFVTDRDKLKKLIEKYKNIEFQSLEIDKVVFYESTLTPEGPIYKVLNGFQLG